MITARRQQENEYIQTVNPRDFDPQSDFVDQVKNGFIVVVGKRRSGKSILIKDLLYQTQKSFEKIYLFSSTHSIQGDFWDFIPDENKFNGLDEDAALRIMDKQRIVVMESKEKDKKKIPHIMFILDDVITDNSGVRYSNFLTNLASNGRHYNICVILATQSFKKVSKHCRDNTDISIAFNFKNGVDKKDFAEENFASESTHVATGILDNVCAGPTKHQAIIVLNYINEIDIGHTLCKWKAREKVPKFRTGHVDKRTRFLENIGITSKYEGFEQGLKLKSEKVEYKPGEIKRYDHFESVYD